MLLNVLFWSTNSTKDVQFTMIYNRERQQIHNREADKGWHIEKNDKQFTDYQIVAN